MVLCTDEVEQAKGVLMPAPPGDRVVTITSALRVCYLQRVSMLPLCSSSFPSSFPVLEEVKELDWMDCSVLPWQSSSDLLLVSQGFMYWAKTKAAARVMNGGAGIDSDVFAVT